MLGGVFGPSVLPREHMTAFVRAAVKRCHSGDMGHALIRSNMGDLGGR